jgi:predicted ester cyclase
MTASKSIEAIFVDYITQISGRPKTKTLLKKYISDPVIMNHLLAFERAFPEFQIHIQDKVVQKNKIVIRSQIKGWHFGMFNNISPTGRRIDLSTICIYEFKDSKISHHWMSLDRLTLMEQLGVLQPLASQI